MISLTQQHKVYLAVQAIDFRCGIDSLHALCKNQFAYDPFNGHYFIFRNRKASAIKILFYDSNGFWLCHKRLSKGSFRHWPRDTHSVMLLNSTQLQVLLQKGDPSAVECEPPWCLTD